jgi:hypothetical protein
MCANGFHAVRVPARWSGIVDQATAHGTTIVGAVVSAIDRDGKLLGRRVLVGEESSCAPIFSATALAVALLIDLEAALSHDSRANEAVGRFEVEEPAPPPPPPVPAQPQARSQGNE